MSRYALKMIKSAISCTQGKSFIEIHLALLVLANGLHELGSLQLLQATYNGTESNMR